MPDSTLEPDAEQKSLKADSAVSRPAEPVACRAPKKPGQGWIPASWAATVTCKFLVASSSPSRERAWKRSSEALAGPHGPQQRKGNRPNQGKNQQHYGKHRSDGKPVLAVSRLVLRDQFSTGWRGRSHLACRQGLVAQGR